MSVDVVDISRRCGSVIKGQLEAPCLVLHVGLCYVHPIDVSAIAYKLGVDLCPSVYGILQFFKDEYSGPLSYDKAVTVQVEGPARLLRFAVPSRERSHLVESGDGDGENIRVTAPRYHGIRLPVLNQSEGIAYTMA